MKRLIIMHIHLEAEERHLVQGYSNKNIQINSIIYDSSLMVSKEEIITNLAIHKIDDIKEQHVVCLLKLKPDLILIGYEGRDNFLSMALMTQFSPYGIGLEFMSIGAACRTHNVLLSEHRAVVSVFII
jgi:uncharacterized protein